MKNAVGKLYDLARYERAKAKVSVAKDGTFISVASDDLRAYIKYTNAYARSNSRRANTAQPIAGEGADGND
jgi:hypothetical protein